MTAAKRYDKQEKKASKMTVKVNDDSYYRLTAKNFDILEAIEQDPGSVQCHIRQNTL